MKRSKILIIPCLAMATTLSWGTGLCLAETTDSQTGEQTPAVTYPNRDPAQISNHRRTTNAQREAAARQRAEKRAVELRDAAASKTATPGTSSPQNLKGGTNE
jgi:Rod binding domain-containing protein